MADETAAIGPLTPAEGLGVLHLFCRLGAGADPDALQQASAALGEAGDQVVPVALLGHKADLGLMAISRDLRRLRWFQGRVERAGFDIQGSYVSLTEVSEYAAGIPAAMRQARLYPQLPPAGKPAFCFYPMSKRRGESRNWYALEYEERRALMYGHGRVGRRFHGRVLQLITGSTGLDDWEWGVTLFAERPDDLKACVYEMRFDPASAHYAEFGPFWTGMVGSLPEVLALCAGEGSVPLDLPAAEAGAAGDATLTDLPVGSPQGS
ncbi:chlorite dismutase family protein [Aciditerrimonas ferrireducens]|jgi:chlorite dismutase|uniref:Coproheme decarboxylase n=1 Tax=Aciditerrimonas ferrireducens TaxID=667306 RepID=A0ABV6C480_9ACTN